jgi:O-methyltransferase
MMHIIKTIIKNFFAWFGFDIVNRQISMLALSDISSEDAEIIKMVKSYTMTQPETVAGLIEAVRYIVKHDIPGAFVECGVWRGGSMMTVAMVLSKIGDFSRDLYLFDTFNGMTPPDNRDIDLFGTPATLEFEQRRISDTASTWSNCPIDEVRRAMYSTGYPEEKIHFIQGNVLDTIPEFGPESISLLRLDTDWYESTRHELVHFFPRIAQHGVLIIDDYGHYRGSREATDDYLKESNIKILLTRMDYSARLAVKC